MQLVRNGNRRGRAVAVLAEDDVSFAAARVVTIKCIRPMQKHYHIRILFQRIMR